MTLIIRSHQMKTLEVKRTLRVENVVQSSAANLTLSLHLGLIADRMLIFILILLVDEPVWLPLCLLHH